MPILKSFTSYVCPVGAGRLGHSGIYTGGRYQPRDGDGICICGAEMREEIISGSQVRFETIDPHYAAEMEALNGNQIWLRLSDDQWDSLPWVPRPVISENKDIDVLRAQYERLMAHSISHEQPIRNVQFIEQSIANPREGGPLSSHG